MMKSYVAIVNEGFCFEVFEEKRDDESAASLSQVSILMAKESHECHNNMKDNACEFQQGQDSLSNKSKKSHVAVANEGFCFEVFEEKRDDESSASMSQVSILMAKESHDEIEECHSTTKVSASEFQQRQDSVSKKNFFVRRIKMMCKLFRKSTGKHKQEDGPPATQTSSINSLPLAKTIQKDGEGGEKINRSGATGDRCDHVGNETSILPIDVTTDGNSKYDALGTMIDDCKPHHDGAKSDEIIGKNSLSLSCAIHGDGETERRMEIGPLLSGEATQEASIKDSQEDPANVELQVADDSPRYSKSSPSVSESDHVMGKHEKPASAGFFASLITIFSFNFNDVRAESETPIAIQHPMHRTESTRASTQQSLALMSGDNESSTTIASTYKNMDRKSLVRKLKESMRRQRNLEMQLVNSGLEVSEDIIDFHTAKAEIQRIAKRMQDIWDNQMVEVDRSKQDSCREEYFKLEQEMERYTSALMLTKEYQEEQVALEKRWEEDNAALNEEALRKIRRHMPVRIRFMTEQDLTTLPSPNGKFLPPALVKRFKRTNILQILRTHPDVIEKMHPAQLESYRMTGLTLTEHRALHAHLRELGPRWEKRKNDKITARKLNWLHALKSTFKDNLAKYDRHVELYGSSDHHPSKTKENPVGCPALGRGCPVRMDVEVDYKEDYGWPENEVFETMDVDGSATENNEKIGVLEGELRSNAQKRLSDLRDHYECDLVRVSTANRACEVMNRVIDKMECAMARWIKSTLVTDNLNLKEEASGFIEALTDLKPDLHEIFKHARMEPTATTRRDSSHGNKTDPRSALECGLGEDVYETSQEFLNYVSGRMDQKDARLSSAIVSLQARLDEFHQRNVARLGVLGADRPARCRAIKTKSGIFEEVMNQAKQASEGNDRKTPSTTRTRDGKEFNHGILAAIKSRNKSVPTSTCTSPQDDVSNFGGSAEGAVDSARGRVVLLADIVATAASRRVD